MSSPGSDPQKIQPKQADQVKEVQKTLVNVQRLTLKAVSAQNLQNLIFIILNDTFQVVKYDRAILFSFQTSNRVEIQGVSGQYNITTDTELTSRLKTAILQLKDRSNQRILKIDDFSSPNEWNYIQSVKPSTVYWIPFKGGNEELGLWLEVYHAKNADKIFESYASVFKELIVPAYSLAWEKANVHSMRKLRPYFNLRNFGIASLVLLSLLFFIPIHLRIVAPGEVVATDSFVVAAPIEGIIEMVAVKPGQEVEKNDILYEYDKKVPYYKYKTTETEIEILQAELNQAYALGMDSESEASKLALLEHKLNKSKVDLRYIKQQVELLTGRSPLNGIVTVDNPDDWRGRPVRVGEKIMTISNTGKTKLRIWIPESDNIEFDLNIPVLVFLNSIPTKTFQARLLFISPEVTVIEGELPGYEAEAEWINTEENLKLGLKGSVVLYGNKVSIFYYLFRKPIGGIRKFFGI